MHSKKDSQDLCFLGDGDYRRFLRDHAPTIMDEGEIVMRSGETLGTHSGLANYTIGQRRGLGISYDVPLYVLDKNAQTNTLIVGTKDELGRRTLTAKRFNWTRDVTPSEPFRAQVKIRYKARPAPADVTPLADDRVAGDV